MATTSVPAGLGRVCGAVIRARTVAQGIFDIVVGERGIVLVPLSTTHANAAAAIVSTRVHGGIVGYRRNSSYDARRREAYLATTADDLARQAFTNRIIRRQDVQAAEVWQNQGAGKLRVLFHDGVRLTLRWERHANQDVDAAALVAAALGTKLVDVKNTPPAAPSTPATPAPAKAAEPPKPSTTRGRAGGRGPARGTAAA
jgi:hypothetical protein